MDIGQFVCLSDEELKEAITAYLNKKFDAIVTISCFSAHGRVILGPASERGDLGNRVDFSVDFNSVPENTDKAKLKAA
jgi:hypothetical protein